MKFSPLCLAAVAAIVFAPTTAHAKCSKNADTLSGSMLVLKDNGEWCETDARTRAQVVQEQEAFHKAQLDAERRAEIAYQKALARHQGGILASVVSAAASAASSKSMDMAGEAAY